VVSQAGLGGEFKSTFVVRADEGLLFSVGSHVILQGVSSLEGFVARWDLANKRSVFRVSSDVADDFGFISEDFSAIREFAHKALLSSLRLNLEEFFTFI